MAGKQAKMLTSNNLKTILRCIAKKRHAQRNKVMVLLSTKAGLRAGEIANLTWSMILGPTGRIGNLIELHDSAAKKCSGRSIPVHPDLRTALIKLRGCSGDMGAVIKSERGGSIKPNSIVNWFGSIYRELEFKGCSSHSGRRTFITNAARKVHLAGGSLRDVQQLAGHSSISMTQAYIEGDTAAKRRLVAMI